MDIKPIFSALMRNKTGVALIVLQVAITLAVVCNSVFIILERSERVGKPSGIDDLNVFTISSLGFVKDFDIRTSIRQDLELIRSLPGVVDATASNTVPTSNGGWSTGVDTQPDTLVGILIAVDRVHQFHDAARRDAAGNGNYFGFQILRRHARGKRQHIDPHVN